MQALKRKCAMKIKIKKKLLPIKMFLVEGRSFKSNQSTKVGKQKPLKMETGIIYKGN